MCAGIAASQPSRQLGLPKAAPCHHAAFGGRLRAAFNQTASLWFFRAAGSWRGGTWAFNRARIIMVTLSNGAWVRMGASRTRKRLNFFRGFDFLFDMVRPNRDVYKGAHEGLPHDCRYGPRVTDPRITRTTPINDFTCNGLSLYSSVGVCA